MFQPNYEREALEDKLERLNAEKEKLVSTRDALTETLQRIEEDSARQSSYISANRHQFEQALARAKQGDWDAYYFVVSFYLLGAPEDRNPQKAINMMNSVNHRLEDMVKDKVENETAALACFALGTHYSAEPRGSDTAIRWLKKSTQLKANFSDASFLLGLVYDKMTQSPCGDEETAQNFLMADFHYKKAFSGKIDAYAEDCAFIYSIFQERKMNWEQGAQFPYLRAEDSSNMETANDTDEPAPPVEPPPPPDPAVIASSAIEEFLEEFGRQFYGGGEFSEAGIRSGDKGQQYYDGIFAQKYRQAMNHKKRARELMKEFPGNERIAKLPSLLDDCAQQIDRLDDVLDSVYHRSEQPAASSTTSSSASLYSSYGSDAQMEERLIGTWFYMHANGQYISNGFGRDRWYLLLINNNPRMMGVYSVSGDEITIRNPATGEVYLTMYFKFLGGDLYLRYTKIVLTGDFIPFERI